MFHTEDVTAVSVKGQKVLTRHHHCHFCFCGGWQVYSPLLFPPLSVVLFFLFKTTLNKLAITSFVCEYDSLIIISQVSDLFNKLHQVIQDKSHVSPKSLHSSPESSQVKSRVKPSLNLEKKSCTLTNDFNVTF